MSIDWDTVAVVKDPKKKEVAVSFRQVDGGNFTQSGSPEVAVCAYVNTTTAPTALLSSGSVTYDLKLTYEPLTPVVVTWTAATVDSNITLSATSGSVTFDKEITEGSIVIPFTWDNTGTTASIDMTLGPVGCNQLPSRINLEA